MYLSRLILLAVFTITFIACDEKKGDSDSMSEQEQIALERTTDSLARVNKEMDSINLKIKQTSDEIDALLDDINED